MNRTKLLQLIQGPRGTRAAESRCYTSSMNRKKAIGVLSLAFSGTRAFNIWAVKPSHLNSMFITILILIIVLVINPLILFVSGRISGERQAPVFGTLCLIILLLSIEFGPFFAGADPAQKRQISTAQPS